MKGDAHPPPDARPGRPLARGDGLWLPALLSTLAVTIVVAGIAVAHFYWRDLRRSMGHMDETLLRARERQSQMLEHFSEAQRHLLAEQRRLQEGQQALRAEESRLQVERTELEAVRGRLGETCACREPPEDEARLRELTRGLDADLAGLSEPGRLDSTGKTLESITEWGHASALLADSGAGPTLSTVLTKTQDALAGLQERGPAQLAQHIEQLAIQATGLPLDPARSIAAPSATDPSARGSGHLGEQFQTALFALRQGDDTLFRLALDTTNAWLAAFYDPGLPRVQALRSELDSLRRTPVGQDLSPLRTDLARLRAILGELAEDARPLQKPGPQPAPAKPPSGAAPD